MTASFVLTKTVGTMIEESLRDARIIPSEQTVQAIDYTKGLSALNNVIKYWQTEGVHLWQIKRGVLPLITSQQVYSLGPSGAIGPVAAGLYALGNGAVRRHGRGAGPVGLRGARRERGFMLCFAQVRAGGQRARGGAMGRPAAALAPGSQG